MRAKIIFQWRDAAVFLSDEDDEDSLDVKKHDIENMLRHETTRAMADPVNSVHLPGYFRCSTDFGDVLYHLREDQGRLRIRVIKVQDPNGDLCLRQDAFDSHLKNLGRWIGLSELFADRQRERTTAP